jgi:phosphoribosylanthranilate isomerase
MVRIKICGITNLTDATVAVNAGADLLGFILYPKSPRYVTPEIVATIVAALRAQARTVPLPLLVGVFVNATPDTVSQVLESTGLDLAQLHGDEPPAHLTALDGRGFKALRPANRDEALAAAEQYWELGPSHGPRLLLDAFAPMAYGGTGQVADWSLAAGLAQRYPGLLLAGGLTPDNVGAAITAVQPWGVDVSSGVEAAPGRKDHWKVRAFVEAALAIR